MMHDSPSPFPWETLQSTIRTDRPRRGAARFYAKGRRAPDANRMSASDMGT